MTAVSPLKRFFPYLFGLTLSLWPLGLFLPVVGMRLFKLAFMLVIILGSLLAFRNRSWKKISYQTILPYACFLAYNLFSFAWLTQDFSPHRHPSIINLSLAFLFFFISLMAFKDLEDYRKMIFSLLISSLLFVSILVFEHLFIFKSFFLTPYFSADAVIGGYSQKNQLGFFLILVFPLVYAAFCRKKSIITCVSVVIFSIAIIYTFSRMSLVGWMATPVLFALLFPQRKKYFLHFLAMSISLMALAGIFKVGPETYLYLKNQSNQQAGYHHTVRWINTSSSRLRYLHEAWDGFIQKPVLGHGFASFSRNNPVRCAPDDAICAQLHGQNGIVRYPSTHNDYAQILYELGGTGIFLFLWMTGTSWVGLFRMKTTPSDSWMREGLLVSFTVLGISLLMINAYDTVPFWFLIGAYPILSRMTLENQS